MIPSPIGNGWKKEDDKLVIDWGDALPAPEAVMELMACNCSKVCSEDSCACLQNKMKCTYLCKLTTCSNQTIDDEAEDDEIEMDEDDDSFSDDEQQ